MLRRISTQHLDLLTFWILEDYNVQIRRQSSRNDRKHANSNHLYAITIYNYGRKRVASLQLNLKLQG